MIGPIANAMNNWECNSNLVMQFVKFYAVSKFYSQSFSMPWVIHLSLRFVSFKACFYPSYMQKNYAMSFNYCLLTEELASCLSSVKAYGTLHYL